MLLSGTDIIRKGRLSVNNIKEIISEDYHEFDNLRILDFIEMRQRKTKEKKEKLNRNVLYGYPVLVYLLRLHFDLHSHLDCTRTGKQMAE